MTKTKTKTMSAQELFDQVGITDFYPGQKIVRQFRKPGRYKSHCVVVDWRNPSIIRVELKAGLTGRDLPLSELKKYPVSLQAPTYMEFDVHNPHDKNNIHVDSIFQ